MPWKQEVCFCHILLFKLWSTDNGYLGHFVVPEIVTRDETDLSNLTTASTAPFTYMFNETYFKYSMSKACPKMKILNKLPDGYTTIKLTAADLTPETYFGRVITHMDQWRPAFDNWLKTNRGSHQFINAALGTPLLNFPIHYDSEDFIYNFGRILQTRRQAQVMAANVLYNMRTKHEIGIQPIGIQTNAYLGAHLRTAADAKKAGWLSYAEQSAFYFVYAASRGLKTIYVTSESEPAATFKSDGEILGMKVLTKEDLLDEPERKELKTMTWDQMALVDYEVLLRAKAFGGIDTSSFSWNIAQRRHGMVSSGVEGWREGEGLNVKDGISSLLGEKWRHEMFREAMWP